VEASVVDTTVSGFDAVELRTGDLAATFVPGVGMVGCSLRHHGEEVLAQRKGLAAYAESGSTFAIPLLHPWANRLDGSRYRFAGREVELDPDRSPLRLDPNGLPIHGLLGGTRGWEVAGRGVAGDVATLSARFDFAAREDLLAAFPFPHVLEETIRLGPEGLEIRTAVLATGDVPVPISFGYHPYLQLPGVPREQWSIEVPAATHLPVDDRGIPTGAREPAAVEPGPLGDRAFDDGYADLGADPVFAVHGGGRRIEVRFGAGYPFAQVYAPPGQALLCFEPMTAPTNALVTGRDLPQVGPGDRFEAAFSIAVVAS
jgi:aldose 1-epimerase